MRTPVSGGGKELKIARTRLRKRRATNYRATARALKRSGVFANGLQGLHDFEVNQFTGLFFGERHDIVQAQRTGSLRTCCAAIVRRAVWMPGAQ